MEAPGAWARAHERPTGAAMAAVPRVVRTGCSICQRGASLKITQTQSSATTALPAPTEQRKDESGEKALQ